MTKTTMRAIFTPQALAAAVALGCCAQAQAVSFNIGEIEGQFDSSLSVGASWQATPNLELNFAYTYLKADTPKVNLADAQGHRLVGEYDGSINLYGVSAQYKF